MEERDKDEDDKTEEASEERRKQFREQGNIANPRELLASIVLIVTTVTLYYARSDLFLSFKSMFTRAWSLFSPNQLNEKQIVSLAGYMFQPMLPWIVGGIVLLVLVPACVGLLMTRFNWTWKKLEFGLEKLNPVSGLARMFGFQALVELTKNLIKITLIGVVMYMLIKKEVLSVANFMWSDLNVVSDSWNAAALRLLTAMTIATFIYGAGDYAYNLFRIEKEMMMTKRDIKDEVKSQEGDPHVKSARRRMMREYALRKNINQVPTATFIVTNPTHFSIALRYTQGMTAPVVVAKGQDFLALRIREIAKEHDIILVENKPLARALYKTVKVGQEIPSSLYSSIIEVMKYIYRTRGKDYFDRFGVEPGGSRPAATQPKPQPSLV